MCDEAFYAGIDKAVLYRRLECMGFDCNRDSRYTKSMLINLDIPTVSGNEDRILIEKSCSIKHNPSLEFTKNCLKPEHLEWLHGLKKSLIINNELLMFHGTPGSDSEYFIHNVTKKRDNL